MSPKKPSQPKRRSLHFDHLEPREVPNATLVTYQPYTLTARDFDWIADQIEALPTAGSAYTGEWIIGLAEESDEAGLSAALGVANSENVELLSHARQWEFSAGSDSMAVLGSLQQAQANGDLRYFYPLIERTVAKRFTPNDTLFGNQWHLENTGQTGGTAGEDVNISTAWDTATGSGVQVAIIDDGVQITHPDLSPNLWTNPDETAGNNQDDDGNGLVDDINGWDYNNDNNDPNPNGGGDNHGTSVSGVAVAKGDNNLGVAGAGFGAELVAIQLIAGGFTDAEEAGAFGYKDQIVDISSNSWGTPDTGDLLDSFGPLAFAAMEKAALAGRNGNGVIFVWAGGNGRGNGDDMAYDLHASTRYSLGVAAVDHKGVVSVYSDPGAALVVAAPSNPAGNEGISTTDRTGTDGYNDGNGNGNFSDADYTNDFGGTSSATPLVAGVVSVILEANPDLTWRDVQSILSKTSTKVDPSNSSWQTITGIDGFTYNWSRDYGFGRIDAAAAVAMADPATYVPVGPEMLSKSATVNVGQAIPDNDANGVSATIDITDEVQIEWIDLTFSAKHTARGEMQINLTSPSGTTITVAGTRPDTGDNLTNWEFGVAGFRGEASAGTWTVTVIDTASGETGTFDSFGMEIYGEDPNGGTDPEPPEPPVDPGPPTPPPNFVPGDVGLLPITDNRTGGVPAVLSGGSGGTLTAFNGVSGIARLGTAPFGPGFTGAVRGAAGDLTGDGVADIIAVAGPGGGPQVAVIDGFTGASLGSFFAFDPAFRGGLDVAAGDMTGDGRADIVVSADAGGGPHVKVFDGTTFGQIRSFFAFDGSFSGGVNVDVGDVNGDGLADIVAGAGGGATPEVRIFDGGSGALISAFLAYDPGFAGGVNVGVGDVNGDGLADVATGPGAGGSAHIRIFDGGTGGELFSFQAYADLRTAPAVGARVGVQDSNNDGSSEIIVAPGPGTNGRVRTFDNQGSQINESFPFGVNFFDGVFVG